MGRSVQEQRAHDVHVRRVQKGLPGPGVRERSAAAQARRQSVPPDALRTGCGALRGTVRPLLLFRIFIVSHVKQRKQKRDFIEENDAPKNSNEKRNCFKTFI